MASTSNAATVAAAGVTNGETVASAEQNQAERNASFAEQLKDELLAQGDESTGIAAETQQQSESRRVTVADKQISADKVLKLLQSGDLNSLAKELGREPKEFKVRNSAFVQFRREEAKSKQKLAEERQQLERERATLRQQSAILQQTQAKIFEAVKHIEKEGAEDWIAFLETATGKSFDEIQKQMVANSLDPSAKEVRRLRVEQERFVREQAERERIAREQQLTQQQQEARARYMGQLRTELLEDEELGFAEFANHPNMPRFIQAVFTEQEKSYDGENVISVKQAAKRALKVLVAEAESWSPIVTKYGNTNAGKSGGKGTANALPNGKTGEQQGDRATQRASKSVARSQGGGSPDVRQMSPQERRAMFAAQLRAELRT